MTGILPGEGSFFIQNPQGTLTLLLDGHFKKGMFASGLLVMHNCVIEGTFINGNPQGWEQFFPDEDMGHYRGQFREGTSWDTGNYLP